MINVEIYLLDDLADLVSRSDLVPAPGETGSYRACRVLPAPASVKDTVEALGIPHCEIGRVTGIAADGPEAGHDAPSLALSDLIADDLSLSVHAAAPRALDDPRFLCDQHLGKLARLLRMTGFDTAYDDHWTEPTVARRAVNEQRVVLSRSRALLKRKALDRALLIRSDAPDVQFAEVLRRFRLADRIELFGRCSRCNGCLRKVAKADVEARIPPLTRKWLDAYYLCRDCDQLYWEGTHVEAIRRRIVRILAGG